MTLGLASYETRFRWCAALWAILMTVWCMSPLAWEVRLIGGLVWVALTLLGSWGCAWWRPRSARDVPIFIHFDSVDGAKLEPLVRSLVAAGYRFQTVREALTVPERKSVVMTFDGGTRDYQADLLPILRRHQVKATCFVTKRPPEDARYLKTLEVQEMARTGLVEFGTLLEGTEDEATLEQGRNWITGLLGQLPYAAVYPEAEQSETLRERLASLGYHAALIATDKVYPTVDERFAIPRRRIPLTLRTWQAYLLVTRGRWHAF